jgi:glycosyltransferase involved in cell wall biosynthesis
MKRLAIVITHPIQYYSPVFQQLAKRVTLKVFYTMGHLNNNYDTGFQQEIKWDIPLLQGYDFEFLNNVSCAPGSHWFFGVDNRDAIKQIKDFEPTAILVYGWAYKSHLKILKYFHGSIRILFRGDSTLLHKLPRYKATIKKKLLSWIYKHVDTAFYVGSQNKKYFLEFGLKESQLVFVPHAVDNDRFKADRSQETITLRRSFQIRDHEVLVLFTGKLQHIKDPLVLLRAFCDLEPANAHLLFVGSGHLEQELKFAAINHLSKVHFIPFQNQSYMPVVYQSCDLFCMPTTAPGESWGLAINEAMAAGKAILSSNMVGAATDLVTAMNGETFEYGNSEDLKSKLTRLIASKCKLKDLGEQSTTIIEDWTIESQVEKILANV